MSKFDCHPHQKYCELTIGCVFVCTPVLCTHCPLEAALNDIVVIFQKPRLMDDAIPKKARSKNKCRKVEWEFM